MSEFGPEILEFITAIILVQDQEYVETMKWLAVPVHSDHTSSVIIFIFHWAIAKIRFLISNLKLDAWYSFGSREPEHVGQQTELEEFRYVTVEIFYRCIQLYTHSDQ